MPSDLVGRLLKAVEAMKASAKRLRLGVDGPLNADALDEGCIAVYAAKPGASAYEAADIAFTKAGLTAALAGKDGAK